MWILIWILVGVLTYAYIRFGKWSKDVFQYNLRVEGESDTAIHIITILFSAWWPLWWLLMFPILKLIGKHDEKWFEFQRKLRNKGKWSPWKISNQYEKTITVDKPEKVPMAISNAVRDVSSRNFVVVHLSVFVNEIEILGKKPKRTFTVKCGGIDNGKLISPDD